MTSRTSTTWTSSPIVDLGDGRPDGGRQRAHRRFESPRSARSCPRTTTTTPWAASSWPSSARVPTAAARCPRSGLRVPRARGGRTAREQGRDRTYRRRPRPARRPKRPASRLRDRVTHGRPTPLSLSARTLAVVDQAVLLFARASTSPRSTSSKSRSSRWSVDDDVGRADQGLRVRVDRHDVGLAGLGLGRVAARCSA